MAAATAPGGVVHEDRARYAPFYEAGERYVHDHGLVVGGPIATKLLLGEPLGHDDTTYDVYSVSARRDAWALADAFHALAPEGLGRYAKATTKRADAEFIVTVDGRDLFRVHALAVHRGARIADIIAPTPRPAAFARAAKGRRKGKPLALGCMGPEIQLLAVYACLADPSRAGEWPSAIGAEVHLRAMFDKGIRRKIGAIVGGRPPPARRPAQLIEALLREYVPRVGHVVVGSYAVAALRGAEGGRADRSRGRGAGWQKPSRGARPRRLQVVATAPLKEEEEKIRQVAARLGFEVQSTTNAARIPSDPDLRRLTMYVVRPGERRVSFIDVYDAGARELVPFASGGGGHLPPDAYVGTPYVVLRFLLADIWTILLLNRMGAASADFANRVLGEMLGEVEAVAAALVRLKAAGEFAAIFPTRDDDYVGRHVDPATGGKREAKRERKKAKAAGRRAFFPPYYAAKEKGGSTS